MRTQLKVPSKMRGTSLYTHKRRQRFSPLMLIGISVATLITLVGVGVVFVLPRLGSHAAAVNPNCSLRVPAQPLTARGLATPYLLSATDAAGGACNEGNVNQSAFVQGAILDPATGQISIYSPLVIDAGTQPLVVPTPPVLPANAIVTLHFGFNGTLLTLTGNGVARGNCVNGTGGTVFGQFAYCNARAFFTAANQAIAQGKLTVPALGTAKDGMPCPTVRDFSVVDMDPSDNVQTQYLVDGNGRTAQLTAANQAANAGTTTLGNPSDNALVSKILDPALGCTPWTAPDLANNGAPVPALVLDELQARQFQQAPIALIPANDEMVLVNNNTNLAKINAYRRGVDQPQAATLNGASTTTFCKNIVSIGIPRIKLDQTLTMNAASPMPAVANNLFTFLATRLQATLGAGGLNCVGLLNIQNPVTLITDGNGVTRAATIGTGAAGGTGGGTGAGGVQQVATGGATITLEPQGGNAQIALNIVYANHPNQTINVNIVTNSCTGQALFSQVENTDGAANSDANAVINNLQGLTAIPTTWFLTVTDPNQAGTPVVGCGVVVSNKLTGTATLGTVTAPTASGGNVQVASVALAADKLGYRQL